MRKISISVVAVLLAFAITAVCVNALISDNNFETPDSSGLDIYSCRYTRCEKDNKKNNNQLKNLKDFELKCENESLAVYFCESTSGIRVLNKKTGYVWGGLRERFPEDLNEKWSYMANSLITLDYLDSTAKESRISLGSEGTYTDFSWENDGFLCSASFDEIDISFDFSLKLKDNSFSVTVLRNTLKEGSEYKVFSIWILPFFGAVNQDEISGYMFVPDGSGALIRYNKSSQYVSAYSERIYGKDVSVDEMSTAGDLLAKRNNDYLTDSPRITVPVYGCVHNVNKNAYLAVIEDGKEYASVYASPAGLITDYNWVSNRFDLRNSYIKPLNKSGDTINTFQDTAENVNCKVTFYLLDSEDANYSGMAVYYRELTENSVKKERKDRDIPIYLNIVAADVKSAVLGTKYVKLTSENQLERIIDELSRDNINNLTVAYSGWQKGGLNGQKTGETKLSSKLGNKSGLKSILLKTEKKGGRFFLSENVVTFNKDQSNPAALAALKINDSYAIISRNNSELMYPDDYYTRPDLVKKKLEKVSEKLKEYNLFFPKIGTNLYGNYSRQKALTRKQTEELFIKTLKNLKTNVMLSNPNDYLWELTNEYVDTPMQNSQYLFESDSVPFLQIVLKGKIDYYAPYANQGFYTQSSILKMIEYGAYPSFILMGEKNDKLIDTPLSDYFSLCYDDWHNTLKTVYFAVNSALKSVEGAKMERHLMIADGVAEVLYDNNVKIYVNYSSKDYKISKNITVNAKDYYVAEG